MSQRVNPAHCITVAPGLTRHLAGGRIGIAESVLREVDVKRGRGDATALTYPQSLNQRPVRGSVPLYSPNPTLTNTMACFVNITGF
jgi:hypothetical protein